MTERGVPLGEIAEINPSIKADFSPGTKCTFIPMEAVDETFGGIAPIARPYSEVAQGYTRFAEGDVLVAKITPCMENGKCAVARGIFNGVGFGSTEFHVLRPSAKVLPEWLFYYWRLPATRHRAEESMTGSAGQKRVPKTFLESTRVPLPSLPEQERIVGLLQRADRLRRTRKYALELSDRLLVAVFRHRFADRLKGGSVRPFGELTKITGGGTPSRARPEYFRGTIPWLTSKDMRREYIWDTEEHVTEEAVAGSSTRLVPRNSVLIVVKSKVLAHRLPVAITKVPMCHGQDIKSIQCPDGILHPEFGRFLLKYHERTLLKLARGANTEGLTLSMLEELPVPDVQYEEQLRFAEVVHAQAALGDRHRESQRQAKHLLDALLDRAFATGL